MTAMRRWLGSDAYRPGEYTLVFDPANASRSVYELSDGIDGWDCNYRTARILVQPDGGIQAVTTQTVLRCE